MRRGWRYHQRSSQDPRAGGWSKWTNRGALIVHEGPEGDALWMALDGDGRYTVGEDEGHAFSLLRAMADAEDHDRAKRRAEVARARAWAKREQGAGEVER